MYCYEKCVDLHYVLCLSAVFPVLIKIHPHLHSWSFKKTLPCLHIIGSLSHVLPGWPSISPWLLIRGNVLVYSYVMTHTQENTTYPAGRPASGHHNHIAANKKAVWTVNGMEWTGLALPEALSSVPSKSFIVLPWVKCFLYLDLVISSPEFWGLRDAKECANCLFICGTQMNFQSDISNSSVCQCLCTL